MIIALAALAAAAAPPVTYLQCDTVQQGTPMHYDITLNETNGTADVAATSPDDAFPARRVAAQFSADIVNVGFYNATISRVDLSIKRYNTDLLGNSFVESGTCHVAPAVKRAF